MITLKKKTKKSFIAAAAAFAVILLLGLATEFTGYGLMLASFGSTCAIVFTMPKSPAARAQYYFHIHHNRSAGLYTIPFGRL